MNSLPYLQTLRQVHAGVAFYHYFRAAAPGKHTVSLCQAGDGKSLGAVALRALPHDPARKLRKGRDPAPA